MQQLWDQLSRDIQAHTGHGYTITTHNAMGGGCINQAFRISDGHIDYFVKLNSRSHGDMFEVEALSLAEMADTNTVRVPRPICHGHTDTQAYVVLEYLPMNGRLDGAALGEQLAAMHSVTANQFGWHRNNTIGSTPQTNEPMDNWVEFWRERRLLPQFALAQRNGYAHSLDGIRDKLLSDFPALFRQHTPQASMLHGDLWGGNASGLQDGTPVIYDPAFYYGDREADLAMTHLFGGFSADFYSAYQNAWPLDDGFEVRRSFYNFYHIINHLNLFGTGYLGQAISMAEKVLSEI